jgi:hypothetical protein
MNGASGPNCTVLTTAFQNPASVRRQLARSAIGVQPVVVLSAGKINSKSKWASGQKKTLIRLLSG